MTFKPNYFLAAVLALTSLSAGNSTAATVSGQQLLSLCTANMQGKGNPLEAAECLGYIIGVSDTFDCSNADQLFNRQNSADVSQMRLAALVISYLENNPAAKTEDAHRAVFTALAAYYPCQAQSTMRSPPSK